MVEKIKPGFLERGSKLRSEQLMDLEKRLKSKGVGAELCNLLDATELIEQYSESRPNVGSYKIWNETIVLSREFKVSEDGHIEGVDFTITKFIKDKMGLPRMTKYTLRARIRENKNLSKLFVSYDLATNDGRGQKDLRGVSPKDVQNVIIPNFKKRVEELKAFRASENEAQKKRMQDLASNDKKEADDMLADVLG